MEEAILSTYLTHLLLRMQHAELDYGDALRDGAPARGAKASAGRAARALVEAMSKVVDGGARLYIYRLDRPHAPVEVALIFGLDRRLSMTYRAAGEARRCDLLLAERIEVAGGSSAA